MAKFPVTEFESKKTPFYYYDKELLARTLDAIKEAAPDKNFHVHYAIKANANPEILSIIANAGLGAVCVSVGEVKASLDAGFPADKVVFAGVGKSDEEIDYSIDHDIACFNVESLPELQLIAEMAADKSRVANVALRVNPNIDAHTHHYITTGLSENKFGIDMALLDKAIAYCQKQSSLRLLGLHFHIGSQLTDMEPYRMLCNRINELVEEYAAEGITFSWLNVGGGLGIDYNAPDTNPIPDFKQFFEIFRTGIKNVDKFQIHFELGRSIVAQCGSLITKVLYVKEGIAKKFVIVDAGFTDLIRPALYQAHHKIENITSTSTVDDTYDVVGPICESSDSFGQNEVLPATKRGDLIALRSAGAYGEIMASQYNCRNLPGSVIL